MKKFGLLVITTAFLFGNGFLKNEDGSISTDISDISKTADAATQQAKAMTAKAAEKAKKAAESINVSSEEIIGDLGKSMDEIKQKVAGMDPAKLVAYLNQYNDVFANTQNQMKGITAQIKELKWTEKFGAKAKDLKNQLATYTDQAKGLKEQCAFYIEKLESYGLDLSAYGIDLSAYGL